MAAEPASQTVRVKLSTNNATAIAVSVKGEYFIKECGLLLPSGTLTLRSNFNGTISAVHSTYGELYSGDTISLMRTDMQPSAGYLSFNSRRYLGHLYARALSSGYIQLVNEVPVAHYLYGVVAYEMNNLYPLDALKAQAIAAKSYVLSIIAEKPNASYHIGDTSADQVYKGYNSSYTNVIEAVDSTISEVLTVNGRILTAYYSASNGGETTVPGTAWPGKRISNAGFAVALDHYDTANSLSLKETVTIPINSPGQISQQLYDMLIAKLTQYRGVQAQGLNLIRSVELSDPKGRGEQRSMTTMTIVVDGIFAGEVEQNITLRFNVSELLLYRVCTNSKLRSYWGEYSSDGSTYTIYHVRWGHGVGLSQRGAQQRASQGENYRSILAFYYPGATLANYSIAGMKDKLNAKQLNYLIEDTKKLKEFQETPSTQEELEKIPTLDLSDISREVLPFKNKEVTIGGTTAVVHEYHTNGIVYSDFCFDMSELPEELIPYATLLTEIYRYVDTEHFSYNDLATEINLKIGGLSFQTGMNVLVWKKDAYRPYFSVHMKCMENQVADGMSLLKEVLLSSKMDNKKRLKEIISELRTKMDTRIPAAGHVYAANRALSYIDPMMKYKDTAEGIGFYEFVKKLDKNFDSNADLLMKQLVRAQMCIFRKENLTLSLTGEFNFKSLMEGEMLQFNRMLYDMPCVKAVPAFVLEKKNEGFKTASKVQYVASAGCFEKEGQEYHGALKVLKTIFSYDYLWVNVRVTGGAYGCMCNFSRNGYGFFTSYRDPNLSATLDVYKKAADYVRNFEAGKRDMTKYIIGTISGIDQPLEPSALGERSFHAYQSGITVEMIQKERNQVLDATEETIRSLADYIESMMDAGTVCAIGNDRKLEEEKEMFKQVCSLNQ